MILLATFAIISIAVSFLCSILEASLLSLTPSYIARQQESNPRLHRRLARLKQDIDRPLAAILTLNTIAHTGGATGVGAQVAVVFGEAWLGVASAVMTLLILVLSEIIPKTIGAAYWRQLAPVLPPSLGALTWLLRPFIWLSELITRRIAASEGGTDMRGEIKALARIGHEEGSLDTDEVRVITNILSLHEIRARDMLTPRTVCVTAKPSMTAGEFDATLRQSPFSRYPVLDGGEHALGYVHRADIHHADDAASLKSLMHPVPSVLAEDNAEQVFTTMLRNRQHLGVVYDDLGIWLGVITMEDILEAILGQDIVDESDNVANLRKYAKQRWTKRGGTGEATPPAS